MDDQKHHDEQFEVSPLVIGLLGILAGGILVGIVHCMMASGWCNNSQIQTTPPPPTTPQSQHVTNSSNQEEASDSTGMPSNSRVQLIVTSTCPNRRESDVCVVCLSNFNEGDVVRVLPHCSHAYHVPCIDKWLASHSSCPLCRAHTASSRRCLATIPEAVFGC